MPEKDDNEMDRFYENIPAPQQAFYLKGSASYDWGMVN